MATKWLALFALFSMLTAACVAVTQFKVGKCDIGDFINDSHHCTRTFYKNLRVNESMLMCSTHFHNLQSCMRRKLRPCLLGAAFHPSIFLQDSSHEKEIEENFMTFFGDENFWCRNGGMGLPTKYFPAGMQCNPVVFHLSRSCSQPYIRRFKASASDAVLCDLYNEAKTCNMRALLQYCNFESEFLKLMEIKLELMSDLQPFCDVKVKDLNRNFIQMRQQQKCPPHALADVAFVFDVSRGTMSQNFFTMKKTTARVARRMKYGASGIQIGVYEFDAYLRKYFRIGKYNEKSVFFKRMAEMKRSTVLGNTEGGRRMAGASLKQLADGVFNAKNTVTAHSKSFASGQRPHTTAVVVVFLTGASNDSLKQAIEELRNKDVNIIFVGDLGEDPMLQNGTGSGSFVTITTKLRHTAYTVDRLSKKIADTICEAYSKDMNKQHPTELRFPSSKWQHIHDTWRRHNIFDFSLLWDLHGVFPKNHFNSEEPTSEIISEDVFWDGIPTMDPEESKDEDFSHDWLLEDFFY